MTFFPWPGAPRGRTGTGQVTSTAFAIPAGAIPYWVARLTDHQVAHSGPLERFGEQVLSFADPDGLGIELVATRTVNPERANTGGSIPLEFAIHGFHSASLTEGGYQRTAALLTDTMGFRLVGEEGNRFRYALAGAPA